VRTWPGSPPRNPRHRCTACGRGTNRRVRRRMRGRTLMCWSSARGGGRLPEMKRDGREAVRNRKMVAADIGRRLEPDATSCRPEATTDFPLVPSSPNHRGRYLEEFPPDAPAKALSAPARPRSIAEWPEPARAIATRPGSRCSTIAPCLRTIEPLPTPPRPRESA
jgi:hypothetical protein